jgi:hypothetical protein
VHPIADLMHPALGNPCWLVKHGHGSFVTMEFGQPRVEISGPELMRVHIEGAPERSPRRSAFVCGDWHLWIYCCRWMLTLNGIQLAEDESDDITMDRALGVLNGQILTAASIEPGSQTTFSFDLGCSFTTYPAPAGTYGDEPAEQWKWYTRPGPVVAVRDDGTYAISSLDAKPDGHRWLPISTPVHIPAAS